MSSTLENPVYSLTNWYDVCTRQDLEPSWGEAAVIGDTQVALFAFADDTVYATNQACPSTGAHVMSRGITGSKVVDGLQVFTIACPLHKEVFRLDTGECVSGDTPALQVHPVTVVADHVLVLV